MGIKCSAADVRVTVVPLAAGGEGGIATAACLSQPVLPPLALSFDLS